MSATNGKKPNTTTPMTPIERGKLAAKAMAKELAAEHRRWNLPLLSWRTGKVVSTKP